MEKKQKLPISHEAIFKMMLIVTYVVSAVYLLKNIIGKNLALGIGEGFDENMVEVNRKINNAISLDDLNVNVNGGNDNGGKSVVVNQYNTFSQAHSRYEIYKAKQQTAAAVRVALGTV